MKRIYRVVLPILILLILVPLLNSCKHNPSDIIRRDDYNKDSLNKPTLSDTCRFDTIYFVNDILPIFTTHCALSGCHNTQTASDDVILDNYADIIRTLDIRAGKPDAGDLLEVLNESDLDKRMPPPPAQQLPLELRNAMKIWIEQGAKNNQCRKTCDSTDVRFSNEVWPILSSTCRGCHSGSFPAAGISINNYQDVKTLAQNGELLGVIESSPGYKPMPPGGSMDLCSINKIKIWIRNGALDN